MQYFILGLTIIICSVIFWQDMRQRAVWCWLFPSLFVNGLVQNLRQISGQELLSYLIINFLIIFLLFLSMALYLYLRYKSKFIIREMIGTGDVLFVCACAAFFSPLWLMLFYVGSLIFSLIFHAACTLFKVYPQQNKTVPLAGFQAVFLSIFMVVNHFSEHILTDDSVLVIYLFNS